jgi:hypothetical protein
MILYIGVREISPFIKCRSIFDLAPELNTASLVMSLALVPLTCSATPSSLACT